MLNGTYVVLKGEVRESAKGNDYGKITLAEMGEKGDVFVAPEMVNNFEPGKKYNFNFLLDGGRLEYVSHKEVK